eukprot:4933354-Pyramimonas_sp.AAC.2
MAFVERARRRRRRGDTNARGHGGASIQQCPHQCAKHVHPRPAALPDAELGKDSRRPCNPADADPDRFGSQGCVSNQPKVPPQTGASQVNSYSIPPGEVVAVFQVGLLHEGGQAVRPAYL